MGVGRIFSRVGPRVDHLRGRQKDFPGVGAKFRGGGKIGEISF